MSNNDTDDDGAEIWAAVKQATASAPEIETDRASGPGWIRFLMPDGSVCAKCKNFGAVVVRTSQPFDATIYGERVEHHEPCGCPAGDLATFTIYGTLGEIKAQRVPGREIKQQRMFSGAWRFEVVR